jgi:hypothetical protein
MIQNTQYNVSTHTVYKWSASHGSPYISNVEHCNAALMGLGGENSEPLDFDPESESTELIRYGRNGDDRFIIDLFSLSRNMAKLWLGK